MKTFKGHSDRIYCIDISTDNTRLASGSVNSAGKILPLAFCSKNIFHNHVTGAATRRDRCFETTVTGGEDEKVPRSK
ncbi:hypothetical protein CY34DRAFT_90080 [Suillus luteus UH-Slu-Lm8-n1]|uniref:Unplaced genomic scaffold CY34scaffold_234, whole genome shotgun sequence n=1 Tax=Suillus luteus UH-Slu-Lm8-n1 TaxID=930992 RepID=A0A0D0AX84_9AGAM|nr:hypothetical protein CY34DRAFT_90080 [Suillus luteus UH-Slu-Lm8-n1]